MTASLTSHDSPDNGLSTHEACYSYPHQSALQDLSCASPPTRTASNEAYVTSVPEIMQCWRCAVGGAVGGIHAGSKPTVDGLRREHLRVRD